MNTRLLKLNYLGLAAAIVLTACSGGDVNISAKGPTVQPFPNNPPASSSEAITTHGVITALSDVTVNGVRYDAGGAATVTYNGEPGTLSDLRRGQVVTVSGRINSNGFSGSANSIRYDANLIGPVESLDAAEHRLIVMGQTVMAGPDAVFASGINPETFAGLSAGSIIQVSGFTDASGAIRATRIDQDRLATELQVIGRVDSLDLANLLFTVNRLTADYSSAIVIDLPGGAPATGMRVKAIGTLSSGLFRVERLASAPALAGSTGRRVQVAGLITRFSSRGDFDIGGSSAAVAAGTAFLNGHADDLRLNAEVVIDGDFASNGRISANRVTFERLASATDNLVYAFRDFTEISVPTVFSVTVTQGPEFSVEVAVDEDAAHRIEVTQTGSRLNFALTMGDGRIDRLEAFVTMPMLERIDLTGVTNARLIDFDQAQMTVNVGGVSRLHGEGLVIDELTATVSGVSLLDFGNIRPIRRANINVGGVSQATLNMDIGATLTGSVSTGQGTGFSTLFYYGTNATLNVARDSSSSVVRLGDTRP